MPESHLRASDADRAAVAEMLGAHMSAGRLSVAEYDERLARAYAARTYGELDELTTDLPGATPVATAPSSAHRTHPAAGHSAPVGAWGLGAGAWHPWGGTGLRAAWASWATTAAIVVSIWLITSLASGSIHPWPIWVIGPWGAVLLFQALTLRGHQRDPGGRQLDGSPDGRSD
jgi:hypothetical protein